MAIKISQDIYWAVEPELSTLIGYLSQKVTDFDKHIDMSGRWLTARDLYYNYYLVNETNFTYPTYGADGFKRLNINHFRHKLKALLSLVTAQRVVPEPIATNTDHKSQSQVNFCKNILKYLNVEKKLDSKFQLATESALVLGAAYIAREWDAKLGDVYAVDPETGLSKHKGDVVVSVYNWLDVIFDYANGSYEDCPWVILRRYVNRWDLVAKFPQHADAIKAMQIAPETKRHRLGHIINEFNEDLIPLYTFHHKKTAALPNGRTTLFLDSNTALFDGDLPYKRIPVARIASDDQIDSPFAYTIAMDLLPIQKVYNALCSVVCTNQAAFGVQNILIPRDASISLTQLTEGLNAIYYDPSLTQGAKPEPLNLLVTKREVFEWIEYLEQKMAQISGVNETIQGQPEANLKSGTALAFVASQALVFISPLSRSYHSLISDTWTGILDILKEYATTPRMILISGLANKAEAKNFTNKDVASIDRVIVEDGNPLTQTLAGRIQIAQDLVQAGLATKEEYLNVLTTGQLEPVYQAENAGVMRIKEENERLQKGQPVKVISTDNHPLDIREHMILLNSPDVRNDPNPNNPIKKVVTEHVLEHINQWSMMDPRLGVALGIPPAPSPPQMAGPPGPPGMPGGAPPTGIPGQNSGKENPTGASTPGVIANVPPVSPPNVAAPKQPSLPPGSPEINQDAAGSVPMGIPPVPSQ